MDIALLKDPSGILYTSYDLNGDGVIDLGDLTLLTSKQFYGKEKETSVITLSTGQAAKVLRSDPAGAEQSATGQAWSLPGVLTK